MIEISITMLVIYLIDAGLIGAGIVLVIMSIINLKRISREIKQLEERTKKIVDKDSNEAKIDEMIKNCPYCGAKAQLIKFNDKWLIKCTGADCNAALYTSTKKEKRLIDLWNDQCERIVSERTMNIDKENSSEGR